MIDTIALAIVAALASGSHILCCSSSALRRHDFIFLSVADMDVRVAMSTLINFKIGDHVVLASGGPRMVVVQEAEGAPDQCHCCWFNKQHEIRSALFSRREGVLLRVDEPASDRHAGMVMIVVAMILHVVLHFSADKRMTGVVMVRGERHAQQQSPWIRSGDGDCSCQTE
jgi:uncharacterized protein YodC (DUF2158 family)